jgi:cell division protein FtsZ
MSEMGKAMMGTGEAEGENRAVAAAEAAISNPLLDDVSMKGARGVLINITGGFDMTLFEVDEAANRIRDEVDPEANIIFGSTFDKLLEGKVRISVVATGIEVVAQQQRPAQTGGVNLSVISSNPAPMPAAYAAPTIASVTEDRSMARMEATPAPMPSYQPAPIVAQGQPAPIVAQAATPRPMMTQQPAMTTSSIGATALQAQPARPPVVKDEMAHLQRATTVARPAERPIDDRPFIAPQAMEAGRGQAQAGEPARRGASLFEKMTSRLTGQPLPGQPLPAQPAAQPARTQTQAPAAQAPRAPMREPQRVEPRVEAPVAQPMLNLDPSDRIAAPRAEEDLLDIPAFLRRQAN